MKKKKTSEKKFLCRECEKEMAIMMVGDGMFSFLGNMIFYCDNKKCERYGDLTVVGIKIGRKVYQG